MEFSQRKMARLLLLILSAFTALIEASGNTVNGAADFNWNSIEPSRQLEYHDCYPGRQCARLILPLDWLNDTNTETVKIAIIKKPAVVNDDDPSFGGTIFGQPGGPGISGVDFSLLRGDMLQDLIDMPGKKHFEILSFDPRGTGNSEPRIECFPNLSGNIRHLEGLVNGALDLSPASLSFSIAAAKADALQCEAEHGKFLSYVGTPNVARDMLAILDKVDELRRETNAESKPEHSVNDGSDRLELRSVATESNGTARLQYFGMSYGTLLGNYFASMFPGRVGRMVLDSVVDADDYANEQTWLPTAADTDEIIDLYFQGCFSAGAPACTLFRKGDSSWKDIRSRFWTWADGLDDEPLLLTADDGSRVFIRSGDIRANLFNTVYDAVALSKPMADVFNDLIEGRTEPYMPLLGISPTPGTCSNVSNAQWASVERRNSVICLDGDDASSYGRDYWKKHLKNHLNASAVGGAVLATPKITCAGWRARPNWVYKGPFGTPKPSKDGHIARLGKGSPTAPLLFMSNRWDPITPLGSARKMAKAHPGAGLLIQESIGHGAIRGPFGPCVKKALAEYFDSGVVPAEELSCKPTRGPWDADEDSSFEPLRTSLTKLSGIPSLLI